MCILRTKSLYCKRKWIRSAGLAMLFIFLTQLVFISTSSAANAADRSISQIISLLLLDSTDQTDLQILDVKAVSTVIISNEVFLPNITVGKITFKTTLECYTSVEINGKHHDAGKGFWHEAYIYGTTKQPVYTIHAITFDGIRSQQSKVLIGDTSMRFTYQGEISAYLDYLAPVVISLYEAFPNYRAVINVMLLGGIDYFSLFQKENVFPLQEKTIWELYNSFSRWYEKNRSVLKSAWPLFSEAQIKVAGILNAVSYLWHLGNFNMIDRSGCVQANELITEDSADFLYPDGLEPPLYWRTAVGMAGFVNSKIGCCTDHAFLTKALLEWAGFKSRRVALPHHWLTEVFIDSSWYTIDASAGVMVNATTESMVDGVNRTGYLFFTPYMYYISADHYASRYYPWFPMVSMGSGLEDGFADKSQIQVILGYYDNPPWHNEIEQLNGR